jgi:DNA ligase 1
LKGYGFQPRRKCSQIRGGFSRCGTIFDDKKKFPASFDVHPVTMTMRDLAKTCEAIAATTKKLQKTTLVADYLKSRTADEAAVSAVFLSGRAFPAWEETTLQVGGRSLWQIVAELSGKSEAELTAAYRQHGDLGAVAGSVLSERAAQGLNVLEVEQIFRQIASARGSTAKTALVRDLLMRSSPIEAKYIIKIITGDLRIGLKESLVEEAIAKAYGAALAETKPEGGKLNDVQRANMLLGDIGETVRLASEGKLAEARMRLFHPLGFMLASPIDSPEEGLSYFPDAAVEDKFDGIRAQAHVSGGEVKFFSRTRDEITESFPELPDTLAGLPQDAILDGEIVAWEYPTSPADTQQIVDETVSPQTEAAAKNFGHARPFTFLQQRLGRKKVSENLQREIPVVFLAFDVLYAAGELVIDRPLRERARILDDLLAAGRINHIGTQSRRTAEQARLTFGEESAKDHVARAQVIRAPVFRAASADDLDILFAAAQARGNEGLMIKDLNSPYTPGKRGRSWLKMKRELATLDVVVTAVEYGHGKRIGVLSDYTFAVWDRGSGDGENASEAKLVNIGKAYSGLTDAEIAEMTQWFLAHTTEDQGFRLVVEPKIVLEVAFNNMMRSDRHESGYALRFPRIVRLRPDKVPEEADTIERVKEIWASQEN